ncbi:M23 family metallopeptidase [Micropruina sonneratiae]|uniref:M23 family metallopeptidase n=1 Tax=Micropruina sonneratiae TaxID=2986940 RepID=UPI0022274834|nr:M23 family metallopeptidase [Micropruina sp. KQZ13P-5]MCW3157413.1 peptidoglycan DD-metalloendopeptidase family protein [Micropruina sp. KQZ13P-5]
MPSPTCHTNEPSSPAVQRLLRPLIAALALSLTVSLGSPATADDLKDRRKDVRKAIVSSKSDVSESKAEVSTAIANLAKAQAALAKAQRNLDAADDAVAEAKALDAEIGRRLDEARRKLAAAKKAVAKAKAEVEAQLRLMGQAARESYQQQTDLVGLTVVFDSADTGDLSQRIQWSTTIFDATSAQMARLRTLQAKLEAAEKAQAAIEKQIAADKAEAEANLAQMKVLQVKAAQARNVVASSVEKLAKARKAAESDLRAERAEYNRLQAQEASISAQIRRRAEIARKKAAAAEAKRRAAAKKAGKKYTPSPSNSGVSAKGFIRPINASPGSPFGLRFHPILHVWRMHRGQDFGAACGTPIRAAASGRVASAGWNGGFGNYVVIDHGFIRGKYVSTGYAHQRTMVVHAGQRVKQGQLIGYVGTTGLSTGCHLHLQVYVNGGVVNPMNWVP